MSFRQRESIAFMMAVIEPGKMLRYKHNDMDHLNEIMNIPMIGILIVTDGVFSMRDIASSDIVFLARKYGARIMVDDAHGLGVLGEGGRGTASYFGLEDEIDIYMGTFKVFSYQVVISLMK